MTDEKLLKKHNQLALKIERIKSNRFSKLEKIVMFFMTVLLYCWISIIFQQLKSIH